MSNTKSKFYHPAVVEPLDSLLSAARAFGHLHLLPLLLGDLEIINPLSVPPGISFVEALEHGSEFVIPVGQST
jgi:hypothetical protein